MRLFRPFVRVALAAVGLLLVTACEHGLPPLVDEVQGPTRAVSGQAVTCSTAVRSADDDSLSLRFTWGDGDTSEWSPLVPRREVVSATHVWRDSGRFVVKAQARGKSGRLSEWLGGLKFVVFDSSIVKWIADVGPVGKSCPAVGADGTVYVATDDGLVALSPDGGRKWRLTRFGDDHSPVVGDDGMIYILHRELYVIDPDGTILRIDSLVDTELGSPALGPDGTIYASRGDTLVALNHDGSLKWESKVPGYPSGSPAVGTDNSICWVLSYVPMDTPSVRVFNADGTPKWSAPFQSASWVSAGENGSFTVVAPSYERRTFDAQGGVIWEYMDGNGAAVGPVVIGAGPTIYVSNERGLSVHAPDNHSRLGLRGWRLGLSVLLDTENNVYAGGDSSRPGDDYYVVTALDSQLVSKWFIDVGDEVLGAPGIGPDGTIYIGTADGYLYAIKGSAPLADAPWPKYAHDARNTSCAVGH